MTGADFQNVKGEDLGLVLRISMEELYARLSAIWWWKQSGLKLRTLPFG